MSSTTMRRKDRNYVHHDGMFNVIKRQSRGNNRRDMTHEKQGTGVLPTVNCFSPTTWTAKPTRKPSISLPFGVWPSDPAIERSYEKDEKREFYETKQWKTHAGGRINEHPPKNQKRTMSNTRRDKRARQDTTTTPNKANKGGR